MQLVPALVAPFIALSMSPAAATLTPSVTQLSIGDPIPQLSFRTLSGTPRPSRESLAGKVTVIDFWASWCAPCVAAFPRLNTLHRGFKGKGILFYSVTYEPEPFVREFLNKHPLESEVAIDDSLATFKSFQAWGIPVVYIFGRNGKLAAAVHPDNLTRQVLDTILLNRIPQVKQSVPWRDPAGAEDYFRRNQLELRAKYPTPM